MEGMRSGSLVVIGVSDKRSKSGQIYLDCKCDCGTIKQVRKDRIVKQITKSCGCKKAELVSKSRRLDITGNKYGSLLAIKRLEDGSHKWECLCDCGEQAYVAAGTLRAGKQKSCGKCEYGLRGKLKGEEHPNWNRGKRKVNGYMLVLSPEHPNADKNGYVREHRKVMSDLLQRPLTEKENVHHINGDRADNRLENLELWNTSQPSGQRATDKVEYAIEILKLYRPEILKEDTNE